MAQASEENITRIPGPQPTQSSQGFHGRTSMGRGLAPAGFGGGGGGGDMDRDLLDARINEVKAQNDARFAEILSRLDVLAERLAARKEVTWQQVAGIMFIGFTAAFALLAYASDRFDGGLSATAIVDQAVSRIEATQVERDAAQDARLDTISDQLQTLIDRQSE